MKKIITALAAAALAAAGAGTLSMIGDAAHAATASITPYTVTAATGITGRPDSGGHGYWALDSMTRTASVSLAAEVALSYCGGHTSTGHCYRWGGKITDKGSFTTIAGDTSPGNGMLNGGSPAAIGAVVTGSMAGTYAYAFYSSWKTARSALVPAGEADGGNLPGGRFTTGAWPELFFGGGAAFYVAGKASASLGTTGGWVYKAAAGADGACPRLSSEWADSSWPASNPWGGAAYQGNILAPGAGHC
jgi:hypothetical protein